MIHEARSPSEYFLKFLLSDPECDVLDIREMVEPLDIDSVSTAYLDDLRKELAPFPDPIKLEDPKHVLTKKWLRKHRIHDLWHETLAVKEAHAILQDRLLRSKIEPMLLADISPTTIIRRAQPITEIKLTVSGLRDYSFYFWNKGVMSSGQWSSYIIDRHEWYPLSLALSLDKTVVNDQLPHELGLVDAPQIDLTEAALHMAQIAYRKALELEHRPASAKAARTLKTYISVVSLADEMQQRSGKPLQEVIKTFQKFRMRVDTAKVVELDLLSAGNDSENTGGSDE